METKPIPSGPVDRLVGRHTPGPAVAPDLLAALQNLLSWRETGHNGNEPWNWAEAAVAKALGVPPNTLLSGPAARGSKEHD